ncbi:hypothetical protein FQN55_005560 [Onygenales sp. PD_40]|nr:hypothetical protein FQN55_005560 [Onygenales sp. PD_40]
MAEPQASYNTLSLHPRPEGDDTSITDPLGYPPHLRASEWPINEEPHAIRWFSQLRKATFSIQWRYNNIITDVLSEPGPHPSFQHYHDNLRTHLMNISAGWRHFTSVEDITMDFLKKTFFMAGKRELTLRYMPMPVSAPRDVRDRMDDLQAGMRKLDDEFFELRAAVLKVELRLDAIKKGVDVGPFPELPVTDTMFEEVDSTWIWVNIEDPYSSDDEAIHTPMESDDEEEEQQTSQEGIVAEEEEEEKEKEEHTALGDLVLLSVMFFLFWFIFF